MNQRKSFLTRMEKLLQEKKVELLERMASFNSKQTEKHDIGDVGDEALASSMQKVQNSVLNVELHEINKIDAALNSLVHGEYGFCHECNEEVSIQRLENYPYASRCITCQEVYEENKS
ncbi:TraR/DksA C4-type zinc finger protein [Candidatus Babeliales bacterium]|nr:TraR/DksA C4-type zinc finger protein [Candidatus Babeliales bacterium]